MLGFMRNFPPNVLSGWSSGTGIAGLFGTFFYLFVSSIELKN
jgi:hypothetical protein